jgi:hypothetical protein
MHTIGSRGRPRVRLRGLGAILVHDLRRFAIKNMVDAKVAEETDFDILKRPISML